MININANINGAKKALGYPTAGLNVIVYPDTYEDGGTTYYKTSTGVGLDVVGQDGGEDIINFAPLLDDRFDKGAYVGSSETDSEGNPLPEYYDAPWDAYFYYNNTSEATRYWWKLTDFHYANLLAQGNTLQNVFFLKAKATTDTSNVIDTSDRLYIYDEELTGTPLTKIKSHIGIQADFYGDELVLNGGFESAYTDGVATDWSLIGVGTPSEETTIKVSGDKSQKYTISSSSSGRVLQEVSVIEGVPVLFKGYIRGNTINTATAATLRESNLSFIVSMQSIDVVNEWLSYTYLYTPDTTKTISFSCVDARTGGFSGVMYADDVSAKYYYQNYYSA